MTYISRGLRETLDKWDYGKVRKSKIWKWKTTNFKTKRKKKHRFISQGSRSAGGAMSSLSPALPGWKRPRIERHGLSRVGFFCFWRRWIGESQSSRTPDYPILFKILPNIDISCIQCRLVKGTIPGLFWVVFENPVKLRRHSWVVM